MKLFNTLSRTLQEFVPLDPDGRKVGMYCCGPTVYDVAHIGNFRTFVFADLVRRYLTFKGFEVRHVMNITDVEDKIIQRVNASGQTLEQITRSNEASFLEDLDTLNCLRADLMPRATECIGEIIALIKQLETHKIAYRAGDGSVYFSIQKYQELGHRYGQLTKLNLEEMRPGERVADDEYEKESVADFALWKARTDSDGEVFWPSPWGEGRPGWHIECSAMSMKLLGPSFDIHLGGEDLIFPHHEDEIAQSEGAGLQLDGHRFVKYWLHGAHLLVEGKKMSKKLGNFFTLRDLLDKGFSGREIRYQLLSAHYRESFNFTIDGLNGARAALGRIDECRARLRELTAGTPATAPDANTLEQFSQALDDDLNVSAVWRVVFDWVRETNRKLAVNVIQASEAAVALATWERMNSVLGIGEPPEAEIPDELTALLDARQMARKAKDFRRADALRDELKAKGWIIEDTPSGARLKRL